MADTFQTNTKVEWNWGNGTAEGYIRTIFREKVTRTIKGSEVFVAGTCANAHAESVASPISKRDRPHWLQNRRGDGLAILVKQPFQRFRIALFQLI